LVVSGIAEVRIQIDKPATSFGRRLKGWKTGAKATSFFGLTGKECPFSFFIPG